jgi:hypothetical protein
MLLRLMDSGTLLLWASLLRRQAFLSTEEKQDINERVSSSGRGTGAYKKG